jgi:hypothetical protein
MAPHADPLVNFGAGVFLFMFCLRAGVEANSSKRNKGLHSQFNGISVLTSWFGVRNSVAKMFLEPLVLGLIGCALFQLDKSLGAFVIIGGVSCMLEDMIIVDRNNEMARRMHDAEQFQQEIWDTYDENFKN